MNKTDFTSIAFSKIGNRFSSAQMPIRNFRNLPKKRLYTIAGALIGIFLIVIVGGQIIDAINSSSTKAQLDARPELAKPLYRQTIGKNFFFPLKDNQGKEVSKINYSIESADFQNEILWKGKRLLSVKGRLYLIVNIKIKNDYKEGIQLRTRDYVRLKTPSTKEIIAPEMNNDPVEIQAISTKYSRVGFIINDTEKNPILLVGEINGKKEEIQLNFK